MKYQVRCWIKSWRQMEAVMDTKEKVMQKKPIKRKKAETKNEVIRKVAAFLSWHIGCPKRVEYLHDEERDLITKVCLCENCADRRMLGADQCSTCWRILMKSAPLSFWTK